MSATRINAIEFYFERFGFAERQIHAPPSSDLGITVVIPCFNEPDLLTTLDSLWNCDPPKCAVEVIVVINSAVNSNEAFRAQNAKTFLEAVDWVRERSRPGFVVHLLHFPDLLPKHAGVGLTRKIGMDEALRRFSD